VLYADSHEKLTEAIEQVDIREEQEKFRERLHGSE